MAESRNMTDLVLDLEQKVQHLSRLITNQEANIRLILDRVNTIFAQLNSPALGEVVEQPPAPKPYEEKAKVSKFEKMKEAYGITDDEVEIQKSAPRRREPNLSESPKNKIAVSQLITDRSAKPLIMGMVEIYRDSSMIRSVRTNQVGVWKASLEPGNYEVKFSKRNPETGVVINKKFAITIEQSNVPVELSAEAV